MRSGTEIALKFHAFQVLESWEGTGTLLPDAMRLDITYNAVAILTGLKPGVFELNHRLSQRQL